MSRSVFVVDDSVRWAEALGNALTGDGYDVTVFTDGLTAAERLRNAPPDVLITDYFMAHLDGGKLCRLAKAAAGERGIITVIVTGGADRSLSRTPTAHADAVVAKNSEPIMLEDLRRVLGELCGKDGPRMRGQVIGYERLQPRVLTDKLHGLKRYLEALQEGIGDAVFGVDAQLRLYTLNTLACELIGLPEELAIARGIDEVLELEANHPLIAIIQHAVATGGPPEGPLTTVVKGATVRVTVAGLKSPDGRDAALVIARDITDLVAAEEERHALSAQLHQADKMSALGQLTAGICHEINNPLAAIVPNLRAVNELCRELMRSGPAQNAARLSEIRADLPELLSDSLEAVDRIAAITKQMREFSHPRDNRGESAKVEELLESALALLANEARFKATLHRDYQATRAIVVDKPRLSQTFLNVILNALQAFRAENPERNWIRITTRDHQSGVQIEVSNNGPPIPPAARARIFEPFFTTKSLGEGTGLGLSISYDTVRRHGGTIEMRSDDVQTAFAIWLPTDTGMVQMGNPATAEQSTRPARILLIDDERILLNSFRRQLERFYDVRVAGSAKQAVTSLASEGPFDLVVCDLLMPEMSGMELFEEVQRTRPELSRRFVFLTGGTFTAQARDFLRTVNNPRAYKPLEGQELRTLVAEALRRLDEAQSGRTASQR